MKVQIDSICFFPLYTSYLKCHIWEGKLTRIWIFLDLYISLVLNGDILKSVHLSCSLWEQEMVQYV